MSDQRSGFWREVARVNWQTLVSDYVQLSKDLRGVYTFEEEVSYRPLLLGRWQRVLKNILETEELSLRQQANQYLFLKYEPRIAG